MSNYRDDTIETVVVASSSWLNHSFLIDEAVTLGSSALMVLGVTVNETVSLEDMEYGNAGYLVRESVALQDECSGTKQAWSLCVEGVRVQDQIRSFLLDYAVDSITLSSEAFGHTHVVTTELITVQDQSLGQRYVAHQVAEKVVIRDQPFRYVHALVEESIDVQFTEYSKLKAFSLNTESLSIEAVDLSSTSLLDIVTENISLKSEVFGQLYAVAQTTEFTHVYDSVLFEEIAGQAWIANTDTWAMSRYAPYSFEGCAVINGRLHLWNNSGVYQEGILGEEIQAHIETGKLNFGDALVHPLATYMEYQLSGENKKISIDVSSTQSGQKQAYTYLLPKEQSDYLTNGRIQFGRGLRGRYFSFAVSIQGTSAEINAIEISHMQTARKT